MTERQIQVMQFLYDHANDIDTKSTELHEIAIMMRNCLHELEAGKENIYTKTCRMDKEFAEEELERTKKQLDIAVDALNAVTATPLNSRVIHDVANDALEQINQKEHQ